VSVSVSVFAHDVLISQEITPERYLIGCEGPAHGFVRMMELLGDRRKFTSGHTHVGRDRTEDLQWWAERVDRFLWEVREIFTYANNRYQNHSPSTLEQFLEIRHRSR